MDKILKTILIISIAIFSAGFLLILPTNAQVNDKLVVEYWSEVEGKWIEWLPGLASFPVFNETNFTPGDGVSRLIRVTNNSVEIQRIATEAIIEKDSDDYLASQLNLTIKEGVTVIFNKTLEDFFDQGETYLSSLTNGAQTQYDFTIAFNSGAGDDYQGKILGFDILVGFEGTEGGLPLPPPGGSTGGGLPPGLTISNETNQIITADSVTITWDTNYFSTSQVIYGAEGEAHTLILSDNGGTPPKYGYAHTTSEYNTPANTNGVIGHSVTIFDLVPSTTYYYRAVSHASFAVSTEHSFTTMSLVGPGEVAGEATERESFEEGGEGGISGNTTTTTTTLPGFVFGKSIIRTSSCSVNLTMTGINPLLASLLCLGQNACDACSNPLIVLLLGIGIIIIALYLAAAKRLNNWIAFIIALAVIIYLLLFVLGICLSPWLIFIIGLLVIGGAVYLAYSRKNKRI